MIVCIAEKPSVAKDIARIIGATTARDGYMEGNGYQVTWTFGHLCELKEPDDYRRAHPEMGDAEGTGKMPRQETVDFIHDR